jgi:hypothetical protein
MKGEVWTIGTPGDYAVLHYSSSGNSAGLIEGFQTLREAESAAWREARRRQAIFFRTDSREIEAEMRNDNARPDLREEK